MVALFFATVAKFDIYVHMVFIVNYGDSLQLTSALVFMVVGGIRTTTERGLWKINRTVFQLQFTLLNAPLDATLTKDVFGYG